MMSLVVRVLMFSVLFSTVLTNPIDDFENHRQKRCLFSCRVKRIMHGSTNLRISINDELFNAAADGSEIRIKKYIRRGANVNYINANGETPLIAAANSGDSGAVNILLAKGADVNHRNRNGDTALHTAAFFDHKWSVESLIKNGAYIDCQNLHGDTALHLAAAAGHKRIADLLKSKGANIHIRNNDGKRPIDMAIEAGKKKVVDVLNRFGDETKTESVQTTHSPVVIQTTKPPMVIQTTISPVVVPTTKPPMIPTTKPTVLVPSPHGAVRNACESYRRFADSIPTTHVRILGGVPAKQNEFPWMAALGHLNSNLKVEFNCGGTLLSENFVLTAAHCVKQSLRLVLVRLGKLKLTDDDGIQAVDRLIEDIIPHPDYSSKSKLNDIALIRIKTVSFDRSVIPACLQMDVRDLHSNVKLIVSGWGSISAERTNKSSTLLKTQLKTMPLSECSSKLLNNRGSNLSGLKNITSGQYCAFDPNARNDSCQGDSGGPLQVFNGNSPISTVVGIVSFGISCGTALPGIYTRVAFYLDWIENIVF